MWGDFIKGMLLGIVVGILLTILTISGLLPIPLDLCEIL